MPTLSERTIIETAAPIDEQAFTVEDYENLPDDVDIRYELIAGEVIVSKTPSYSHQLAIAELVCNIAFYLDQNPLGQAVSRVGVIFDDYNLVTPDVVYLSFERKNQILKSEMLHGAPELVVEVVSPGKVNARRDRVQKLELYDEFAVSEYWIVDLRQANVEIYRRVNDKLQLVETVGRGQNLTTPLLPDFQISINDLFSN